MPRSGHQGAGLHVHDYVGGTMAFKNGRAIPDKLSGAISIRWRVETPNFKGPWRLKRFRKTSSAAMWACWGRTRVMIRHHRQVVHVVLGDDPKLRVCELFVGGKQMTDAALLHLVEQGTRRVLERQQASRATLARLDAELEKL